MTPPDDLTKLLFQGAPDSMPITGSVLDVVREAAAGGPMTQEKWQAIQWKTGFNPVVLIARLEARIATLEGASDVPDFLVPRTP